MLETTGDIWSFDNKYPKVITTNGYINSTNKVVMGRGVALQAKQRFPDLPLELADFILENGLKTAYFEEYNIFCLPVKYVWNEKANINLIEKSIKELVKIVNEKKFPKIYMVKPGCLNGGLLWIDVKSVIEPYLDDRFIVTDIKREIKLKPLT